MNNPEKAANTRNILKGELMTWWKKKEKGKRLSSDRLRQYGIAGE